MRDSSVDGKKIAMVNSMKDFESWKRNTQVILNSVLHSVRITTKYAFGRPKARCENLTERMDFKVETVPKIVITYFVLHDFCEPRTNYIDRDLVCERQQKQKNLEKEQANLPDIIYWEHHRWC